MCVCVRERERERERRQSKQVLAHAWIELPKKNMAERRTFHFTHFLYQIINHHAESGKEKKILNFSKQKITSVFFFYQSTLFFSTLKLFTFLGNFTFFCFCLVVEWLRLNFHVQVDCHLKSLSLSSFNEWFFLPPPLLHTHTYAHKLYKWFSFGIIE